jgi:hypothetical protein
VRLLPARCAALMLMWCRGHMTSCECTHAMGTMWGPAATALDCIGVSLRSSTKILPIPAECLFFLLLSRPWSPPLLDASPCLLGCSSSFPCLLSVLSRSASHTSSLLGSSSTPRLCCACAAAAGLPLPA